MIRRLCILCFMVALWPGLALAQSPALLEDLSQYRALDAQGRYAEAEPFARRALELSRKEFGPDHSHTGALLNNLALLYQAQGRYAEAEPLQENALAIMEKALGPEHPHIATSLINLAGLYWVQGRYAEAEPLFKRSLAIDEKALGPEHPIFATTLENYATLLREAKLALAAPPKPQVPSTTQPAVGVYPSTRRPGESFRDCAECPEMVVIPAGSFMMGSPESEKGRYVKEGPQHRVTIPRAFALGKYEVTFAEWNACVGDGGCSHRLGDADWGRGDRPVINVSWDDAKQYVRWMSRRTGRDYRLPSEAEWEYAARAGTTTAFHFGDRISPLQANYDGNYSYNGGPKGVYRQRTVAVGSFPANAFGLHDVHGNVGEWLEDCWHRSYGGAPTNGNAWTTGDCGRHVIRGGSWGSKPRNLRTAYRFGNQRSRPGAAGGNLVRSDSNGFRIARTLP